MQPSFQNEIFSTKINSKKNYQRQQTLQSWTKKNIFSQREILDQNSWPTAVFKHSNITRFFTFQIWRFSCYWMCEKLVPMGLWEHIETILFFTGSHEGVSQPIKYWTQSSGVKNFRMCWFCTICSLIRTKMDRIN